MSTIDEAIARAAKFRAERNEVCWTWERGGPSRIARDRDALAAEIATLTARVEHYKRACITTSAEVTRVLGEALYGPNPDAWSTHTPEAIADEAAAEIASLRAALTDANMRAQNWQQKAERMAARNVNPKIAAKGARHLVGIDFNLRACECDHCEDIRFVFRELAKGGRR